MKSIFRYFVKFINNHDRLRDIVIGAVEDFPRLRSLMLGFRDKMYSPSPSAKGGQRRERCDIIDYLKIKNEIEQRKRNYKV